MYYQYIELPKGLSYSSVFSVKPEPVMTLWSTLHTVLDHRRRQRRRHNLRTILTLAILALCSGHTSYLAMQYSSLLAKAQNANITPTDLATVCTITNCTLPASLPHGIYLANGDVNLNTYNFPTNKNYVFLVNGNLTLQGDIAIPLGSTALFSTAKNIIVSSNVGSIPTVTTSNLTGWYIAGQSFIVNTNGNCNDLRLNIAGSVVVNTSGTGGTFQNKRDLCTADTTAPSVSFNQRLDMILNAPQFIRQQQTVSKELAP